MKNALLGLFFILIPLNFTLAQGWNLVHPEYRNAYYADDEELVATGLKVDSIRFDVLTGEQIFHLNTIVRRFGECSNSNNCTFLRRQEQFLGLNYRATENGWRTLRKDGSHRVFRYDLSVGEEWTFNESDATTAIILSRGEQEILPDLTDSIMVFATSAADTFSWAKTYGIVEYRPGGDGPTYRLSGIKELEIGDNGLGFDRIFDFNLGDRFYYQNSRGGGSSYAYTRLSVEILGKTVTDSSYVYDVHRLSHTYWIDMLFPAQPDVYVDTFETVTYLRKDYPTLESFPRELVKNPHDMATLIGEPFTEGLEIFQQNDLQLDDDGHELLVVGRFGESWTGGAFQIVDGQDELNFDYSLDAYQQFFAAGRGERSLFTLAYSDIYISREQVGAIILGDTIGQIFSDSILTVGTREPILVTLTLKVFPNPAQNWLSFQTDTKLNRQDTQLLIHDGLGRIIKTLNLNGNNRIDVSQLAPGWYSLSLIDGGKRYLARWLKQ